MSYDIGFNFRATSGYVTDPSNTTYALGDAYPVTRSMVTSGLSVTFGFLTADLLTYERDRDSGVDPRLAGCIQVNSAAVSDQTFRVDVPSSGSVDVSLAFGDVSFGSDSSWQILDSDGTTVLSSQTGATTTTGQFRDATAVTRSNSADWVSNNAVVSVTLSGTIFYLKLIATAGITKASHLRIYQAGGGGPTVSTVSSNSANEGTSIVHTVTLSAATTVAEVYAITLAGGTATGGGTDYTNTLTNGMFSNSVTVSGGNITVPIGVSSFTVTIPTTTDALVEGAETYTLTIGGTAGTGTINDLVVFTVNSVDLGSFTGFATFTVTASGTSGVDRDIVCTTSNGTAAAGVDYTATTQTVTILAGNLTADFLVPIINTRKPDTDLVTTGWTVTGAANHAAALADNSDAS